MSIRPKASKRAAAVLNRAIRPDAADLPPAAARALLKWQPTEFDRARMHDLATKNQSGDLTDSERDELEGFLYFGMVFDLLQAKARCSLKKSQSRR